MIVIPAIDLRGGRAVRLLQGDPTAETAYSEDPVEVAMRFQEEGARRLHVVDLDAALDQGDNRSVVEAICRRVQVPVQVGGGLRSMEDISALLETGASRAILGTAAAADATFVRRAVEEFAESIVVAIDVRAGHVMVRGWQEEGPALEAAIPELDAAGAPRYLVTSIARDGTTRRRRWWPSVPPRTPRCGPPCDAFDLGPSWRSARSASRRTCFGRSWHDSTTASKP